MEGGERKEEEEEKDPGSCAAESRVRRSRMNRNFEEKEKTNLCSVSGERNEKKLGTIPPRVFRSAKTRGYRICFDIGFWILLIHPLPDSCWICDFEVDLDCDWLLRLVTYSFCVFVSRRAHVSV